MFVFSGSNLLFPQLLPLTPDSLSKHHRTNLNWFCISFLRGADRHHSVRSRHRGLVWETHAPPDSHSSSHWENMDISIWSAIKTYSSETNPDHIRTDVNETWWLLLQKDCGGTVVQRCLCSLSFACWHSDGKLTRTNLSFPHLLSILKAVQLKKSFSLTGSNPLDPGRDTRPVAV